MRIEFSWRYWVMGVYFDRGGGVIRVYPIPFVRISLGSEHDN
jgi:hypothetical protein